MKRVTLSLLSSLTLAWALHAPASAQKPSRQALTEQAVSILESGIRSASVEIRALSVAAFGYAPKKTALPHLQEALSDPQWPIQRAALQGLIQQKDKAWIPAFQKALCNPIREPGRDLLPLIADEPVARTLPILLAAVEHKDCARPQSLAAPLMDLSAAWAKAALPRGLSSKVDPVRQSFESYLDTLPLAEALPHYQRAFAKAPAQRQTRILQRLAAAPNPRTKVDFVLPALKSDDAALRFLAARTLALHKKNQGKATLLEALAGFDETRRVAAFEALREIPDAEIHERMKEVIRDRATPYRELVLAYEIYHQSPGSKLSTYLQNELQSTDLPQRAAAAAMWGKVVGERALNDLHPLLSTAPPLVREAAIAALADVGSPASIPVIQNTLTRERQPEIRVALIHALAQIPSDEIVDLARFSLAEPQAEVRLAAVQAIAKRPSERLVQDLDLALRDRQEDVREAAVLAIIASNHDTGRRVFHQYLNRLPVRILSTLVDLYAQDAAPYLRIAILSDEAPLRTRALNLLSRMSPKDQKEIRLALIKQDKLAQRRLDAFALLPADADKLNTARQLLEDDSSALQTAAFAYLLSKKDSQALEDAALYLQDSMAKTHLRVLAAESALRK